MDADGGNVKRLTNAPGYDGGAYFSPDCKQIVWRASRPQGAELDDYRKLLAAGLVRPGKLEIWLANADGSEARQLTYLDAASFAPSFFPDGKRVIFSSNYGDPAGREFELWAVNTDGTGLERITYSPGFDGFPMFSPDGTRLAFASNRNNGAPHETNVFVARWQGGDAVATSASAAAVPEAAGAERFAADVRWLADDAREGRGVGTPGLAAAQHYLADRFEALGLEPAGDGGTYFHTFDVPVAVAVEPGTTVALDGRPLDRSAFQPAGFSASADAQGPVVIAGWGIVAPELGVDDYKGIDVHGKIVAVRRFTPRSTSQAGAFTAEAERRYGDLRYKAYTAREHGALGLLVVDLPESPAGTAGTAGEALPEDAPLPRPALDAAVGQGGDAGIPVAFVTRAAGAALFRSGSAGGAGGAGGPGASVPPSTSGSPAAPKRPPTSSAGSPPEPPIATGCPERCSWGPTTITSASAAPARSAPTSTPSTTAPTTTPPAPRRCSKRRASWRPSAAGCGGTSTSSPSPARSPGSWGRPPSPASRRPAS